jgi:hypothetical protein
VGAVTGGRDEDVGRVGAGADLGWQAAANKLPTSKQKINRVMQNRLVATKQQNPAQIVWRTVRQRGVCLLFLKKKSMKSATLLLIALSLGCLFLSAFCKKTTQNNSNTPPSVAAPPSSSAAPYQKHPLPVVASADRISGLTMVAPPRPFPVNPMQAIRDVSAKWIAVVPYAFTRKGQASVHYNNSNNWKWWGESPVGTAETIRLAHEAGIKVMLKPQVYVPGGWTGSIDFASEAEWVAWESDYEKYILPMARTADSLGVEMFCVGTEFNTPIQRRPDFWRALIQKIRVIYPKGKLVYSSNWDDWSRVPFWDQLDYIGLSGYYPLVDAPTPSVDDLRQAWVPIRDTLRAFSERYGKPILFSEYGYLTVDGCGWRNWETEPRVRELPINQQAQANCFEAMFATFQPESWWAGGFLWKWFPNGQGHEGYPERDYTPQGKMGEQVISKWHKKL